MFKTKAKTSEIFRASVYNKAAHKRVLKPHERQQISCWVLLQSSKKHTGLQESLHTP
jgi:hypothetical protein